MKRVWTADEKLNEAVRAQILRYAYIFLDFIAESFYVQFDYEKDLKDIMLVGSSTNYFYTSASDLDIHILMDTSKILKVCSPRVANDFSVFLEEQFITFYRPTTVGRKMDFIIFHDQCLKEDNESYVSDLSDPDTKRHASLYSVLHNEWIARPKKYSKEEIQQLRAETILVYSKMKEYANRVIKEKLPTQAAHNLMMQFTKDRMTERFENPYKDYGPCNNAYRIARRTGLLKKLENYIKDTLSRS